MQADVHALSDAAIEVSRSVLYFFFFFLGGGRGIFLVFSQLNSLSDEKHFAGGYYLWN